MTSPRTLMILAFGLAAAPVAQAQDTLTGEGSLSAGYSTGNTDSTDLGLALTLDREVGLWTYSLEAAADYGETDAVETENRIYLAGEVDRQLADRLFSFVRGSYERDEFSGYEARYFLGAGLGYLVLENEQTKWSVQGGPGLKVDEVEQTIQVRNGVPVTNEAMTEESFSLIASSQLKHAFNEAVDFSNQTKVIYAQESTQIGNVAALTAAINHSLSARFSFDVRHDTNPPAGFAATDTITRAAVVYTFGD